MVGILKTRFQIFIFFLLFLPLVAQCDANYRKISWKSIGYNQGDAVNSLSTGFLNFEGANFIPENGYLPMYFEKIQIDNPQISSMTLSNEVFEPLSENENALIKNNNFISNEIKLKTVVGYEKKQTYSLISFVPIRKNPLNGKLEKLISFNLNWTGNTISQKTSGIQNSQRNYAASSVLSSGNWYKIGVTQNGIHKLSYAFLKKLGLDVSLLNPKNIRIYGNGGGMLPFANSSTRWDDLRENAILVHGEENQILDSSDYVLFYGENPHVWKYDAFDKKFHHQVNLYSDTTYYFINADIGSGKRIGIQSSSIQSVTDFVSTFDDYAFHENDAVNLLKSGMEWYGEYFDIVTSYPFNFYFSNLVSTSPVYVKAGLVARNTSTSKFSVSDGSSVMALSVPGFSPQDFSGGDVISASDTFSFSTSNPSVTLTVSKLTGSSVGWLNYLELNARRVLKMAGEQLIFRDIQSLGSGNVSQFNVMGGGATQIWEVTDPSNIHSQHTIVSGNDCQFSLSTDSLRTFCAFSDNSYYTPKFFGKIENQNLHGLAQSDLIIVTHPDFINQANALAEYHHSKDGMSVSVATTNQIYNEFSSGGQDIAAIRDFVKMFYDRAASLVQQPKYLLLLGDGSYDNKKRLAGNTNFVPTFQSKNSTVNSSSYVSDDFYGLLDDNEGNSDVNDLVDIGIGRLPVQSVNEAQGGVNKIIKYASSYGDWRNVICFVADDQGQGTPGGDGNTFVDQADGHAGFIQGKYKNYNIDKIYCDAYQQVSAPGGQRYPDVNEAISRRLEKGALIINYTGHGGETAWAHEEIIDVPGINNLKNNNNLPLFVTATCEFSRFDDPSRTSAGEYVLLNPNGGGIALLTTVRLVFGSFNATLNTKFYQHAFEPINGEMPRLGDLYRLVKGANAPVENNRKFVLLGDPALRLAYPNYDVVTTSVNGKTIDVNSSDTLKALDIVNVTGHLNDKQGNKLSNFNGTIYPSVFDKNLNIKTLTNDGGGGGISLHNA